VRCASTYVLNASIFDGGHFCLRLSHSLGMKNHTCFDTSEWGVNLSLGLFLGRPQQLIARALKARVAEAFVKCDGRWLPGNQQ
jgi:hypothetical protein